MNEYSNVSSGTGDVSELLGAYVLDAVDDVERRRVERAAAADPQLAAEIERLRVASDALGDVADFAPPAGLWESIQSEIEPTAVAGGFESKTAAQRGSARPSVGRPLFLAAAAVAVVFVIGAGLISVTRSSSPTDSVAAMTAMANDAATKPGTRQGVLTDPDNTMEVRVIVDASGHGFIMSDPLPALPDNETYQLWSAANGTMVSLGMLGSNPEMSLVAIDGAVTELALTREPIQGSVSPTSNPMATGRLI